MPTNLRERLLKDLETRRLAQIAKVKESLALQDLGKGGLFPGEERLRRDYLRLQDEQLAMLAEQRRLLRSAKAAVPREKLVPVRDRGDYELFRKSGIPRWAAIAGLLERLRNHNVALSRADFSRAKAQAAARSRYDLWQSMRGDIHANTSRSVLKRMFGRLRGVDVVVDPCVEILARQKARRQVMFAQGSVRGYRGRHHRRVC